MTSTVLLAVLLLFTSSSVQCEEFTITLDADDKFNLTWSFDATDATDYVTFSITCETTGWVGLGLSPNGGMAGADIAVAWVTSSGDTFLEDMYADANGLPSRDSQNDLTLVSSSEANGITSVSYKRKISTCDEDDNEIMKSTTRLIFAYGSSDPTANELASGNYHGGNKGAKSIYLLESQSAAQSIPQNARAIDMVVENYEVPNVDTTYYCSFHDPPALNETHHLIAAEPLITPGNEGIVHHIVVYACWGVANEHLVGNNKTRGRCFYGEMPEFFESCRSVLYAWAIGGSTYYFPEDVGFPIGGTEEEGSPQYFLMETHYDNPELHSGKIDSSGIRFIYTPTLRTQEAATVQVGNIYGIFVPPQADDFTIVAYCHSTCTSQWIPEEGIYIFGYMLHAHLLGVGIKVEQFRDGESIGIFAEDSAYDFNYQEARSFASAKKVLRGDTLKISCHYKSGRDTVTYGGEATSREMCLAFLLYYPRQDVANCESFPSFVDDAGNKLFSSLSIEPLQPADGSFIYFEQTLNTISSWTPNQISLAQEAVIDTDHYSQCIQTGGDRFPNDNYYQFQQSDYKDGDYKKDYCDVDDGSSAVSICAYYTVILITALGMGL